MINRKTSTDSSICVYGGLCYQKHGKNLFSEGWKTIYNGFSVKFLKNFTVNCVTGGEVFGLFGNAYMVGVFPKEIPNIK